MDYMSAFEISGSGMALEKARLDIISLNLANANTTKGADGETFKPLRVLASPKASEFEMQLQMLGQQQIPAGVNIDSIQPMDVEPRLVFEPNHPHANEKGYVEYPGVNTVSEMVHLIEATRSYEANVKALNAAKSMALRALEIGRQK